MELENLSDVAIVQCTLYGEARGESLDGMAGVAWVIRNRVEHPGWWGTDYSSVCLRPKQFSCFNHGDPNRDKIIEGYSHSKYGDPTWRLCRYISHGVIYNWIPDLVHGANHYCHVNLHPKWAEEREVLIVVGNHKFYLL